MAEAEATQEPAEQRLKAALLALLVIVALIGAGWIWNDFTDRREQREAIDRSSVVSVEAESDRLSVELERSISGIAEMGQTLVDTVSVQNSDDVDPQDLAAAVIKHRIADTHPAIDLVLWQDPVAAVVGVDRHGSLLPEAEVAKFDVSIGLSRFEMTAFVDDRGSSLVGDSIALYYPAVEGQGDGWLIIVARADYLAIGGTYVGIAAGGDESGSISRRSSEAVVQTTAELLGSSFVAEHRLPLKTGDPPGWAPFFVRLAGLIVGLISLFFVGRAAIRMYGNAMERAANGGRGATVGFEQTIVGVAELDETGVILNANQAYCTQVGKNQEELVGMSLLSLTASQDRAKHLAQLDRLISGGGSQAQVEHRLITDEGEDEVWVLEHLTRRSTPNGDRILVQSQDITFRRYATWELAKQALHDELTGLPNRAMLVHRLKTALERGTGGEQSTLGLMYIDIDRFKMVNDTLGHEVGDQLIKHVGDRMRTAVRPNDTVSRFGGDEFVVLCENVEGISELNAIASRLQNAVANPFTVNGARIHQTLSIGIAACEPGEMNADELLSDADAAMYRAKQQGRNRVAVFDEGMRRQLLEQVSLEEELRAAIETEQIVMYFQPIVNSTTYATAGFEALIRWNHPERGLLPPGMFLPVAEEAGLQERLDNLALKLTCEQMADWAARYPMANDLYVSSNKVPRNFAKFIQTIRDTVARSGLPPHLLVVEVVENALIEDAEEAIEAIEELKAMGVRVAIDDFGTGYSSLSYLTQFSPTTLKIDRAFVNLLPEDSATAAVVKAITDMALALDINVIAEGVETWEQAQSLHGMGVPYFQGYLFAKPRPSHQIEEWLESNKAGVPEGQFQTTGASSSAY